MRGKRYDTTWKKQVVNALDRGLKTVCAPVFDMLVPLMFIELMNISLPIKNTDPSFACVSLLRLVKPIIKSA
jgi:hypothetical protein